MRDDHDGGLSKDMEIFSATLVERRRALSLLGAAAGSAFGLAGLGSVLSPRAAAAAGSCQIPDSPEIAGPFPADGTNHANGETSDVLTESGVVRRDVRRSFLSTTTKAKGLKVHLKLTLVNTNAQCVPLAGWAVFSGIATATGFIRSTRFRKRAICAACRFRTRTAGSIS